VHVLAEGRIVASGDKDLALKLEAEGYAWLRERRAEEQAALGR
ncbi:MAG TPA: Fe-S cluster assembly ATPase SufC, partial [Xanthomonadales bacterium]|nr:Fe-S cluster assembly ATPase SufC [Xanthomonadales bacterium]